MKQIVCDLQLFDTSQVITILDESNIPYFAVSSTLDELSKDIVDLCQRERTNKVHLFGTVEYIDRLIIPEISRYSKSNYGLDNIEVEIN